MMSSAGGNTDFLFERAHSLSVQLVLDLECPGLVPLREHEVEFILEVARLAAIVVDKNRVLLEGEVDENETVRLCEAVCRVSTSYDEPTLVIYMAALVQMVVAEL